MNQGAATLVQSPDSTTLAIQLVQLLGALALVIGLIFLLAWFARRRVSFKGHRNLRIIERLVLGKNQSLLIVQLKDQRLLLGVTGTTINLLQTLAPGEAEPQAADPTFAAQLANILGR